MAQVIEKIAIGLLVAAVMLWLGVAVYVCAQDLASRPRIPNINRIAKAWNSIQPAIEQRNEAMGKADALLHERFNPKILVANPDEKRRETVGHYKAAREALLKELEALNVLIEEEDY